MLKIARKDVGVQNVIACTACTTGTQKLDAPSAKDVVWPLVYSSGTKLCSFCLVEAEAIAKEKRLERKARKLEKDKAR